MRLQSGRAVRFHTGPMPRRSRMWLVTGTAAAITSTVVLSLCGWIENRNAVGPNNGPGQWMGAAGCTPAPLLDEADAGGLCHPSRFRPAVESGAPGAVRARFAAAMQRPAASGRGCVHGRAGLFRRLSLYTETF